MLVGGKDGCCVPRCLEGRECFHSTSQHLGVSRVHCRLLGFSPELGQRVHFAEGTNLRCREDKKSPTDDDDSEERLAKRRKGTERERERGRKRKKESEKKRKEPNGENPVILFATIYFLL